MNFEKYNNDIILYQEDFDLDETLDCGQAFRWTKISQKTYCGYFLNNYLEIVQESDRFILRNTSEENMRNIWIKYFDLDTDYGILKQHFSQDRILEQACRFAGGIRLLRQDPWECLCSFIISQNNNIPRIKGIMSRLCSKYNQFPTAEMLSHENEETLQYLRSGFRAKYIVDAAAKISSGIIKFDHISQLSYDEAKKELMLIKGVGPKVADCVLLYGMYRTEAYPVDVWIKRVLENFYPDGMPECTKGYEGIAQQYLFHYIRNNRDIILK